MTIQQVERIENCAQRRLPIEPELVLMLTAYLRDTLQAKVIAEAIAFEAIRRAGLQSRYKAAGGSR